MFKHTDNTHTSLGVDIGGTHLAAALVADGKVLDDTYRRAAIDPGADAETLLDAWAAVINSVIAQANSPLQNIGLAMPGPFDYSRGISLIRGLNKYESLYGIDIREALRSRLSSDKPPITFANDAACFGLGVATAEPAKAYRKIIAITLGTGLGACFIHQKKIVTTGIGVPPNGYLYCIPFKEGIAEDYLSARWLLETFPARDVKEMATNAVKHKDPAAIAAFRQFGANLGLFLSPWIKAFEADALVIGGSIAHSQELFLPALKANLNSLGLDRPNLNRPGLDGSNPNIPNSDIPVLISEHTEQMAIAGAAGLPAPQALPIPARRSLQPRLPKKLERQEHKSYDLYPVESLGEDRIFSGYDTLATWIATQKGVRIDGYQGLDWDIVRERLCTALRTLGIKFLWHETRAWQKPEAEIDALVRPFLGPEGSVWGTKTTLDLSDFYATDLASWQPSSTQTAKAPQPPTSTQTVNAGQPPIATKTIPILAGTGSGLSQWDAPIVYFDIPKNEIQYRLRAGSATNLGAASPGLFAPPTSSASPRSFPEMYKRSYFVDWVVLNKHRRAISRDIAIVADGQREEDPNWASGNTLREAMQTLARNGIRARPWFEPGVWGGQWIKQHIPQLSKEEINYAWSFELIAPENGIVFESGNLLLEIAFDWLMQFESKAVLGVDTHRFGEEFPIRFDFLDTFGGGNLSIQCHPSLAYIRQQFGETITQDETYYILDSQPGAGVYLGFTENIDPAGFRRTLEQSQASNEAIDIEAYVQFLPAKKHDLFLIPNQTIHGSGVGNLVLEISATPYIFTFKMYDWMRLDLDGAPRPINIEHAFHNLDFTRKGGKVREQLVSRPQLLKAEDGMQLELLPTHPEHFYSIHRITLTGNTRISTNGRCHLLMLVEGKNLIIKTKRDRSYRLHYAETFLLPAAAEEYELLNPDATPIIIIKAFVK